MHAVGTPVGAPSSARAPSAGPAQRLARIGLVRDWDFLLHLPIRYVDETRVVPIDSLVPGAQAQVEGEIVDVQVAVRRRRQLLVRLRDASGELLLRWVHFYASQQAQFVVGRRLRVLGRVRGGLTGEEMIHPQVRLIDCSSALPVHLTPIYPTVEGVPQHWLRRRIDKALSQTPIEDLLPPSLRDSLHLMELRTTLQTLHRPSAQAEADALLQRQHPAWQRLQFEELLAQQLALRQARARRARRGAVALRGDGRLTRALLAAIPFTLTVDQRAVWEQIERDLASATPMNRLLQGDVGSGKTIVAALAAARALESGYQAALMAPTEILAEQHFQRFRRLFEPLEVNVAWLGGRPREALRRTALADIASGAAGLVIGTHALIQEPVQFARLGLAIVDEQHRFGVEQRLALRQGHDLPHLLMLSATPIPRSLAMTYLGDLDVSVIRSLPPGRQAVRTKLISGARRDEVLARIRAEIAAGRQAYWVCPLVEESDEIEATAAVRMAEQTRRLLPELRIGLLHGQMSAAEKKASMEIFAQGKIDVLVATTVVEVGVDVANASLMVIEHAQRFGLATLHQLRGRVGRGTAASTCVLLFDEPLSEPARERLKVVYETSDGFEIAARDLRLRGPGEFLGARQWGLPMLRFADLERDVEWLDLVRHTADQMLESDPRRAAAIVERWYAGAGQLLGA
ncbi:MAG TPA: ATP-dependent DNA helicase RecG [Burkholderiaceae bacterium]|nr:ATP-dependent DNA helicase RecG [Burkholderiaceae bacterium]